MSDNRNFWNNECLLIHSLASFNCFTYRNLFQNGANDISKMVNMKNDFFVKKRQILSRSNHLTLFKFHWLVVKMITKELQIIFYTSNVRDSNGNVNALERKI